MEIGQVIEREINDGRFSAPPVRFIAGDHGREYEPRSRPEIGDVWCQNGHVLTVTHVSDSEPDAKGRIVWRVTFVVTA